MLDKAVKTPCTGSRLYAWGILGKGPKACTRPKGNVRGITPEARRHVFCPAWRTWDRHYGIGTHLRADGLSRPIKNMIALAFPGLLPPMWSFYWGDGSEWGLTKQHDGPKSARAPTLFVSLYMRKQKKIWEGPERGGEEGLLCRRCTRQNLRQHVACTLANLTRGEVSLLLLHEPPQLGAAPPTHLIGWGSMHFDCYGPNKCGCVTISMPNPFRDRGPTCALGHRGRAPTE